MPYGTALDSTRRYIEKRAAQSNISLDKIGLDGELPEVNDSDPEWPSVPSGTYNIAVIFGGALDEEFTLVGTLYEVNVADWIAEQCREEAANQGGETWEVIVSEFSWDEPGTVRYRVSDSE